MHEIAFILLGMPRYMCWRKMAKHMLRRTDAQVGGPANMKEENQTGFVSKDTNKNKAGVDGSSSSRSRSTWSFGMLLLVHCCTAQDTHFCHDPFQGKSLHS